MTKTTTIMLTVMTISVLMLMTAPLQSAQATLTSTSPTTVMTASGTGVCNSSWHDHNHFFHSHFIFGSGNHHIGHFHWFLGSTNIQSQTTGDYDLRVPALKDMNINVASAGLLGTTITFTDADTATTTVLAIGDNPITPVSKGDATISAVSSVASQLTSQFAGTCNALNNPSTFSSGHNHPSSLPSSGTSGSITQDFTLTIDQANAGGPKARLSQGSDDNLLGFSAITLFMDLPRNATSLDVSAPGANTSCDVFDNHGALRGTCSSGSFALAKKDLSGLWSVVADGTASTTISAIVQGDSPQSLELLTATERT